MRRTEEPVEEDEEHLEQELTPALLEYINKQIIRRIEDYKDRS